MIDITPPGPDADPIDSPGWWMLRLARKLESRQKRLRVLDDWYRGDPPLPEGARNMREAYRAFQRRARTNFAELIVEAVRERMQIVGFRTAAGGDDNGDQRAREIWDANGMDVEAADLFTSMLAMSDGYVIVGLDNDTGEAVITAEDPRQVVTIHDPVRQRIVRAGLKLFHDPEQGKDLAYLYLPGRLRVATRDVLRTPRNSVARFAPGSFNWDEDLSDDLEWPVVPVVRFRNRRGVGEFESHIDLLGRINHQILQRMVIATMQAYRQRAIKNAPQFDEHGNEIDYDKLLAADPGAVWTLPEAVELWESGQVDLTPILSAVKDDVRHLSAVTRTPLPMLDPDGANQTAEGAASGKEGLIFKVEDRLSRATEGMRDVMSLSFLFTGDEERAARSGIEVLWAPPERRSMAERADAASKATDIPWRTKMTDIWGFSPQEVDRMESERATDALLLAASAPPAPPPAGGTAG